MELSALVLAGGASRRMGRNKVWLEFGGQSLLQRAIEKARAVRPRELFISGRAGEDYSPLGGRVLYDHVPGLGPLGGLERGLEECSTERLLVVPVDLPFLTADFLRRLVAKCGPRPGLVPKLRGQWEPLVAIYPKSCLGWLREALTRRQLAASDFAAACWRRRAVNVLRVPAAEARCFVNWNTPEDVARDPAG
jgi:molybdopterin-guanine dinucleotide biosynthesis protein A